MKKWFDNTEIQCDCTPNHFCVLTRQYTRASFKTRLTATAMTTTLPCSIDLHVKHAVNTNVAGQSSKLQLTCRRQLWSSQRELRTNRLAHKLERQARTFVTFCSVIESKLQKDIGQCNASKLVCPWSRTKQPTLPH